MHLRRSCDRPRPLVRAVFCDTLDKPSLQQIESEHLTIITLWPSVAPSRDDMHHCRIDTHTEATSNPCTPSVSISVTRIADMYDDVEGGARVENRD